MTKSFSFTIMLECWDDGTLMEVSYHTFVGWLVGVGGPHPSKTQTLNIFNEEVVDIRLCEVQRAYIQVRKHSSSLYLAKWGLRALMTTPMERTHHTLEWRR
jgi:hypothetical protein